MQGRLSLWYKKKVRKRLFFLGIILGLLLNVDSIQLFEFFNGNQAARQQVTNYYAANAAQLDAIARRIDSAQSFTSGVQGKAANAIRETAQYDRSMDSLSKRAQLPVGPSALGASLRDANGAFNWSALWWKIIGVIITGFAASFVAPFWFQVLKKAYTINPITPKT